MLLRSAAKRARGSLGTNAPPPTASGIASGSSAVTWTDVRGALTGLGVAAEAMTSHASSYRSWAPWIFPFAPGCTPDSARDMHKKVSSSWADATSHECLVATAHACHIPSNTLFVAMEIVALNYASPPSVDALGDLLPTVARILDAAQKNAVLVALRVAICLHFAVVGCGSLPLDDKQTAASRRLLSSFLRAAIAASDSAATLEAALAPQWDALHLQCERAYVEFSCRQMQRLCPAMWLGSCAGGSQGPAATPGSSLSCGPTNYLRVLTEMAFMSLGASAAATLRVSATPADGAIVDTGAAQGLRLEHFVTEALLGLRVTGRCHFQWEAANANALETMPAARGTARLHSVHAVAALAQALAEHAFTHPSGTELASAASSDVMLGHRTRLSFAWLYGLQVAACGMLLLATGAGVWLQHMAPLATVLDVHETPALMRFKNVVGEDAVAWVQAGVGSPEGVRARSEADLLPTAPAFSWVQEVQQAAVSAEHRRSIAMAAASVARSCLAPFFAEDAISALLQATVLRGGPETGGTHATPALSISSLLAPAGDADAAQAPLLVDVTALGRVLCRTRAFGRKRGEYNQLHL
ncbi:MAG: hypothetical protein EOO41_02635, partial [Methanobacteriota archaeon]